MLLQKPRSNSGSDALGPTPSALLSQPSCGEIWITHPDSLNYEYGINETVEILHVTIPFPNSRSPQNYVIYRPLTTREKHVLTVEVFILLYFPQAAQWEIPAKSSSKTFWQWLQHYYTERLKQWTARTTPPNKKP